MSTTLNALFAKEFYGTMRARSAKYTLDLFKIGVPRLGEKPVNARKVMIKGITDEYYSKLNKSVAMLWARPKLLKRKYGSDGKFLRDKDGKVVTEQVQLPRDCIAIVSSIKLGVPLRHKPNDVFKYVDYVRNKSDNTVKFVYIIPKKYCYLVSETALVLCAKPMRSYYDGMSVYLQNGHKVYLYIVPFKVTSVPRSYRVLKTKASIDYSAEINSIISAWTQHNICFNKNLTQLNEPVRDVMNVAFKPLGSTLDDYVPYSERSLSKTNVELSSLVI